MTISDSHAPIELYQKPEVSLHTLSSQGFCLDGSRVWTLVGTSSPLEHRKEFFPFVQKQKYRCGWDEFSPQLEGEGQVNFGRRGFGPDRVKCLSPTELRWSVAAHLSI